VAGRLYFIAGEPSGDRLGAALLRGLRAAGWTGDSAGVGGPLMAAQGMRSLFAYDELAVMGLAEILPKYVALKRRIAQTARDVLDSGAEALITIDSPDFCLRVAGIVRRSRPGFRTIHYVAPSVWAWRPGRAARMARVIDHVLALLPFEPPYMEAAGMSCDFVGHPVVTDPVATRSDANAFRAENDIAQDERVLVVLPGSRRSEITRLAPVFGAALEGRNARIVLPTLPHLVAPLETLTADWPTAPILLHGDEAAKRAAFKAADAALAASGTVSLELAASRTPMVIAYDFNWLTRALVKRAIKVDTVTLVNLVSETRAVPECLAENCTPEAIRAALDEVLRDGSAQHAAMALTMERLGQGGDFPGFRAAHSVLRFLRR